MIKTLQIVRPLVFVWVCVSTPVYASGDDAEVAVAERAARQVMDEFLNAFNARDTVRLASTLHFPHVRIASGGVVVVPSAETFIATTDMNQFAQANNWHHSEWDAIETVQADASKVHFKVKFSRFNPQGVRYVTFNSLYVIQKVDGRWAIRGRSSFAP